MSRYYCLIAGLPSITPDDAKLTYSVADFKALLEPVLTEQDKRLMRWFYLKYDNRNILSFIKKTIEEQFDDRGNFSKVDIHLLFNKLKAGEKAPAKLGAPAYMTKFFKAYLTRLENETPIDFRQLEDELSAFYFEEAMRCGNDLLAAWFEMNLNIGNMLAALNCRKYGLEREHYIIGDNEIANRLRQSNVREVYFGDSYEYLTELTPIVDEPEPMVRERRLEMLRWKWLDNQTFFKAFEIEIVIAYMLRLEIIERWVMLDKVRGEMTFRSLVSGMKQESAATLEEFKENNK